MAESVDKPHIYWDVVKAYLRGCIITFVTADWKHVSQEYKKHSEQLRRAQTQLNTHNTREHRRQWEQAENEFNMWATTFESSRQTYRYLQFHRFGNKAGSLLARLTKEPHKQTEYSL